VNSYIQSKALQLHTIHEKYRKALAKVFNSFMENMTEIRKLVIRMPGGIKN